jgi:DNA-binding MarR family transcriptional regulator
MASPAENTAPAIRGLLNRKTLASYRQRAVTARRLGVTESELVVLIYLAQSSLTPGQLGERLHMTSGGVTAVLHRLERGGHVRRRPHVEDNRSVILSATPETVSTLADLLAPMIDDIDAVARRLTPGERDVITSYLREVAEVSERRVEELARGEPEPVHEPDFTHAWA